MDSISGSILPGYTNIGAHLYNNPSLVAGKEASALRFSSSQQQYAVLDNHPNRCVGDLDLCSEGITMSFWMYSRLQTIKSVRIFDSGGIDNSKHGISLFNRYDNDLRGKFKLSNGEMFYVFQSGLALNTWIHFTMVWHRNYFQLYVDGCFVKKGNKRYDIAATTLTYPMHIAFFPGGNNYANIDLDEFYIYEEVKTPAFIKLLESGFGLHNL